MMNGFYGNANGNGNFNNNNTGNNEGNTSSGGNGFNNVNLFDCRIAGTPDYIPAHTKPGATKVTQAQTNFTVFQNRFGKKHTFQVTAWGKMADVIARGGATGKQLNLVCSLHSYRGRVWLQVPDGSQSQFVLRPDGQPLMIEKTGLTVEELMFGKDSEKTIQEEIKANFRPQGWNNPASPGYQQWRDICRRNNSIQFEPNMQWFGYARVKQVNGTLAIGNNNNSYQQQQLPNNNNGWQQNQQTGNATQYQGNSGAVSGGFGQNNNGYQQNQNNNGGNPEYVNGQYVGQQMPNQQQQNNTGYNPNHQFQPNQANQNNGVGVVM